VSSTSISARKSFYDGFNSPKASNYISPDLEPIFIEKYFGENIMHLFDVSIVLGLFIYMLSKEKMEDGYKMHCV
tara:strand:+ start:16927 stop:17148 length:222 start_codon:yes stop_codon:yes gene_type:complete